MKKASLLLALILTTLSSLSFARDTRVKPNSNTRVYDSTYRTEEQRRIQRENDYLRRNNPQTARGYNYNGTMPIGQGMEKDSSGTILETTTFRE